MKMTQSSSWEPWKICIFFSSGSQNPACRPLARQVSPSSEGVRGCPWALGLPTWVVLHDGTIAGHPNHAQGCLNLSCIFFSGFVARARTSSSMALWRAIFTCSKYPWMISPQFPWKMCEKIPENRVSRYHAGISDTTTDTGFIHHMSALRLNSGDE